MLNIPNSPVAASSLQTLAQFELLNAPSLVTKAIRAVKFNDMSITKAALA